jgi:hypothetical protein
MMDNYAWICLLVGCALLVSCLWVYVRRGRLASPGALFVVIGCLLALAPIARSLTLSWGDLQARFDGYDRRLEETTQQTTRVAKAQLELVRIAKADAEARSRLIVAPTPGLEERLADLEEKAELSLDRPAGATQ